jgi:DNA replication and repair protein RecF
LLEPGLLLVTGANGAGKTNLLESLHVGTQGFSPRTHSDSRLIRFGETGARISLAGRRGAVPLRIEVTLQQGAGKRAVLNGSVLSAAEQLRAEVATLVFTPDRLAVVKAGPAVRRAYFDRALARLSPARATLAAEYASAVSQRNAALRRVAGGRSSPAAVRPWTEQVVELGRQLVEARLEVLRALSPLFGARAGELGLDNADLRYEGEPATLELLESRFDRDLERGATGAGPHLDDVAIVTGSRDLRYFGSQGEQRLAVLSLLLAESELLLERRGVVPLLLLDDVLSELDPERRRILASRVESGGQAVVTATDASFLPTTPAQHLEVGGGQVRAG